MRRTFVGALIASLIATTLGWTAPAQAAAPYTQDALRIKTVKRTENVKPGRIKQLKVRCPDGTAVLHGGAWFHRRNQGGDPNIVGLTYLLSTHRTKRTWSAIGYVNENADESFVFEANVTCTPRRLTGTVLTASDLVGPNSTFGGELSCGAGEQVYGTAAWWASTHGEPPLVIERARVVSSGPTGTQNSYFAGVNFTGGTLAFARTILCTDKLQPMTVATETDGGALAGNDAGPKRRAVPMCGGGKAISGGAHFHLNGQSASGAIAGQALLGSSSYQPRRVGWFAYGDIYEQAGQDIRFTATVLCLA